MGDRANVAIRDGNDMVYLYTHWTGTELPGVVQAALRCKERWTDAPYLARMVFSAMIEGSERESTGYGISTGICDNDGYPLIELVCGEKEEDCRVELHSLDYAQEQGYLRGGILLSRTFQEYCDLDDIGWPELEQSPFYTVQAAVDGLLERHKGDLTAAIGDALGAKVESPGEFWGKVVETLQLKLLDNNPSPLDLNPTQLSITRDYKEGEFSHHTTLESVENCGDSLLYFMVRQAEDEPGYQELCRRFNNAADDLKDFRIYLQWKKPIYGETGS